MDPDPGNIDIGLFIFQLILFVSLITISFFISGAEVAFFSLTKIEREELKSQNTPSSNRVVLLLARPQKLLATILIANNFANVAAILVGASLMQLIIHQIGGFLSGLPFNLDFLLNVVLITSVLLFFGEIVPKVYAARNKKVLALNISLPLQTLQQVLRPLIWVLINLTSFIDKRVEIKGKNTSLEDLRHALDITANEEHKEEREILKGIVNFSNIPVKSIMRARVDVIAVDIETAFNELVEFINTHNYSRLPVYENSLDTVKGVLHIKDLLPFLRKGSKKVALEELLRPVHFVPESKKINDLLEEFKRQRLHMAVVVDEYGGTAGIVTLEDVIEEIFGEITDEFDREDMIYTKLDDLTYIFQGRISLNDVKRILDLPDGTFEDVRGDSDSLGGLILELHGKFPTRGEMIEYGHIQLTVESVSETRINQVKFHMEPAPEKTEE